MLHPPPLDFLSPLSSISLSFLKTDSILENFSDIIPSRDVFIYIIITVNDKLLC